MKIVFCIKSMEEPGGGAERVLADVASGLTDRGHDVRLMSWDSPGGASYYPIQPAVARDALGVGDTTAPTRWRDIIARVRVARRYVRSQRPDVVVGFMHSTYVPMTFALIGLRIPLIASEHTVLGHYRRRPLELMLLGWSLMRATLMTVVSEQVLAAYPTWCRPRMRVAHNPVTLAVDGRTADVRGQPGGSRTLLTVGSLVERKDQATLIDAFAQIADQLPEWELRIVGEGPLRPVLEQRIEHVGLQNRITLVGAVADIGIEFANAQLFVLPSRYESLGLALAEALGYGLPGIGFADCPGVNELIRSERSGVLVRHDGKRAPALAAAMEPLMRDEEYRVRLTSEDCMLPEELRLERVLDRWEGLLAETVNGRSGAR